MLKNSDLLVIVGNLDNKPLYLKFWRSIKVYFSKSWHYILAKHGHFFPLRS